MTFDPLELQRLVDGELSREDTKKLLARAENEPEHWREMACAFVENQFWSADFDALEAEYQSVPPKKTLASPSGNASSHSALSPHWLSIAAGMMLALTVGLMAGQIDFLKPDTSAIPAGTSIADTAPTIGQTNQMPLDNGMVSAGDQNNGGITTVGYRPDYHLELEDINGNPVFDSEVPLYNWSTARDAGYRMNQPLPTEFVERVRKQGFRLNQDTNYVSGRLDDGRMFIVPVQTIRYDRGQ